MNSIRIAYLAVMVLLAGCATTMSPQKIENQKTAERQWAQRRADLAHVNRFIVQARLSYGKLLGVKVDLRWEQNPDGSFELRISGPFGVGAATITGTRKHVLVRTRDGEYETNNPEKWIEERMGWTLPIGELHYWMLGLPAPMSEAAIELNIKGQILVMEQDGWKMEYNEYQSKGGYDLPRRFVVTNPTVQLKVVVGDWSELPAPRG